MCGGGEPLVALVAPVSLLCLQWQLLRKDGHKAVLGFEVISQRLESLALLEKCARFQDSAAERAGKRHVMVMSIGKGENSASSVRSNSKYDKLGVT